MKKKLQKLLSFLTVGFLTLSSANFVTGQQQVQAEAYSKVDSTLLLNRIGISVVYDEDSYITRGDFTALAVQALGVSLTDTENYFTDVSENQAKYINMAAQMGLVDKAENKLFYPNRIIKPAEAAKICLNILGYGDIMKHKYSYPDGYMKMAMQLDLLPKKYEITGLTGAAATEMIFNTLDTEYIEPKFTSNYGETEYVITDRTYMKDRLNIEKSNGRITSICGVTINGAGATESDKIRIDSKLYLNPYYCGISSYTYLGKNVEFYTKDTSLGKVVVYIRDKSEDKVVDMRDITQVKGFDNSDSYADRKSPSLTYFDEETDKKDTIRILPEATVVVNGESCLSIANQDLMTGPGKVRLIDGDNNGTAEVIILEKYRFYWVRSFDREFNRIDDKNNNEILKLDNFDQDKVYFVADGKDVTVDVIGENALLKVMCSYTSEGKIDYDKTIIIAVSTQTVEGTIEAIDDEERVIINGQEFDIAQEIKTELLERLGSKTLFYLGDDNYIAAYEDFKDGYALDYGFLVAVEKSNTIRNDVMVRIYTEDKKMKDFEVADKFKYTGVYNGKYVVRRAIKDKDMLSVLVPMQLVKYQINSEGKLEFLEIAYDHTSEEDYQGYDKNRFSLDYSSDSTLLYQTYVGDTYRSNKNSVYFFVDTTSTDEEDYSVGRYLTYGHYLEGGKVRVYDSDHALYAGVVVVYDWPVEKRIMKDALENRSLITNIRKSRNFEDEFVTEIEVFAGGYLDKFSVVSDDLAPINSEYHGIPTTVTRFDELEVGDWIYFGLNHDGDIDRYVVLFEYDKTHTAQSWGKYDPKFSGYDYLCGMNLIGGTVTSFVPESSLTISASGNQRFGIKRSSLTYYEYNVNERKVTKLSYVPTLSVGDYVWVHASRNDVSSLTRYINE